MNAVEAICRILDHGGSRILPEAQGLNLPDAPSISESGNLDRLPQRRAAEEPPSRTPEQIVLEADEITLKVGDVVLSMTREEGGTLEIRAPRVRIVGEQIVSEAEGANTIAGESVVSEARLHNDVLGKLIRVDGQCVQINS